MKNRIEIYWYLFELTYELSQILLVWFIFKNKPYSVIKKLYSIHILWIQLTILKLK